MNDWDENPERYQKDSEGRFILKKDGTPRKKSGRAKGSKSKGYNYHSQTKQKIEARKAVREKQKRVDKTQAKLKAYKSSLDNSKDVLSKIDNKISIATVYRTVKLFEESGILTKHEFKGGKARYEELNEGHHDHLIDVKSGEIIEFVDEEIEKLQKKVAEKYGYKLVDHKLELYGVKVNSKK